ncbi:hypothetical protein Pfo_009581 [Paulownia fortunei]|nr:hypothetical protein Pfo_009581 [Paulownia fortunei]
MESLSYAFEGRGLLFTDSTDFQVDGLVRSRNLLNKWGGDPLSVPTRDAVERMGFVEPVLPDMTRKSFLSNQYLESSGDGTNDHSGKSVQSASTVTLNSLLEFGTRFSSSANKANEKLAAPRERNGNRFSTDNSVLSSPEPSVSAKRPRITNLQSPIPTCQVLGCNKDLSSSKDYHKRHKVCDVHSKTAVVIVNGIQQRFCQQCSRFHLLAEFDEGKRSCRKRLAGHNERRRKPQFDTHLGSIYLTTDASKTSSLFSRILPGGFFGLQCNELNNHSRHLKLEEEPSQRSQLAVQMKFDQSLPKCFPGMGQEYPSKNCLNAPLSVQELSLGSNSSCALSLLSAQSHNLLSNSAGMSLAHSLISKENHHANLCTVRNSAKPLGKSTSENFTPMIFNSSAVDQEGLPVVPDASVSVGFEIPQNELSQESNALNLKSCLSAEGANTVNLLELSLHLQRVEQQKYSAQEVKLENGIFCHSAYT